VKLRFLAILAILPIFAVCMSVAPFTTADAYRASGVELSKYGSDTDICGIQLCSEIEGGKDAWIASMTGTLLEKPETEDPVTISLPLHRGYYDGGFVYYIVTDSSDTTHAEVITESQGWKVELAPSLANVPEEALSRTYMFTNGIAGEGMHGYQGEVFTSTPAQPDEYSPLSSHVHVTWVDGAVPKILSSEGAILTAAEIGDVVLTELPVVINMPQVVLDPPQMEMVDRMPDRMIDLHLQYGFYAGERTYHLYLESTDFTHAALVNTLQALPSVHTPKLLNVPDEALSKTYFFTNGVESLGVHGFQRQLFTMSVGADNYSPLTSHIHVTWVSDGEPVRLESEKDLLEAVDTGDVVLTDIAVVMNMPRIMLDDKQVMELYGSLYDDDAMKGAMTDDDDDVDDVAAMTDDDDDDAMEGAMTGDDADDVAAMTDDGTGAMTGDEDKPDTQPTMKLNLARTNVPVDIPLHKGYYDGQYVYYIITDTNDSVHANIISENQGWRVELAPFLENAPDSALSTAYMFTNGVAGDGTHGFQNDVLTSTPAQSDIYSPLTASVHATWAEDTSPRIFDSEDAILRAAETGEIELMEIPVVINRPQIIWPDGQMLVRDDPTVSDDMPYGGGQILEINTEEMFVTFVAHRGWGPDGRTSYYIVTDATPSGPADMMGVVTSDATASLILSPAAVDLYQFKNGIVGSGPLGFQPGIASGALGDANYSPMWRIFLIEWVDPADAQLLENMGDILAYADAELITISLARPMNSDHIVNCPFIDPFQ